MYSYILVAGLRVFFHVLLMLLLLLLLLLVLRCDVLLYYNVSCHKQTQTTHIGTLHRRLVHVWSSSARLVRFKCISLFVYYFSKRRRKLTNNKSLPNEWFFFLFIHIYIFHIFYLFLSFSFYFFGGPPSILLLTIEEKTKLEIFHHSSKPLIWFTLFGVCVHVYTITKILVIIVCMFSYLCFIHSLFLSQYITLRLLTMLCLCVCVCGSNYYCGIIWSL